MHGILTCYITHPTPPSPFLCCCWASCIGHDLKFDRPLHERVGPVQRMITLITWVTPYHYKSELWRMHQQHCCQGVKYHKEEIIPNQYITASTLKVWASCQIRKIAGYACGLAIPTCITARAWRISFESVAGKRSRHSRHMRNPQFNVSGKTSYRLVNKEPGCVQGTQLIACVSKMACNGSWVSTA